MESVRLRVRRRELQERSMTVLDQLNVATGQRCAESEAALPRFFSADGVDLVNFGDFRAFMLVEDNLYKIHGLRSRHYEIERHYRDIAHFGYQKSPINSCNVHQQTDARYGLYVILHHLIERGVEVTFLDVGSFVGDVGLRFGNFFRTIGYEGQVFCFDPTVSGDLIPYNIQLNGLGQQVNYCPVAISRIDGYITFATRKGHSDSSCASLHSKEQANTIVKSIRLSDFIREQRIQHALIKLDTENLEHQILRDIGAFLLKSYSVVGFEFHSHQKEMYGVIEGLLETHVLYDIGYLPQPFCFAEIRKGEVAGFVQQTAKRRNCYTDILAVSKKIPALEELQGRIGQLAPRPAEYSLIYE